MLAFPSMIVPAALAAGIAVPPDDKVDDPDSFREDYPHFFIFCQLQLGRAMSNWTQHWGNAKVIAKVPVDRLKTMTAKDFRREGVQLD